MTSDQDKKFNEMIRFARTHSPFYRAFYKDLPEKITATEQVPIIRQGDFWRACSHLDNQVLTGPMTDGVVFKSGGTTGNPKFSVFTRDEWQDFNEIFGQGMARGIVESGDRVVNLFYVGQLYGSFLFINKSFEQCPQPVLQFPMGGSADFDETQQIINDFSVNVIAGVPTTILNFAEHVASHKTNDAYLKIKKILFGGEAMFADQRERLAQIFPDVRLQSIGYASTDAGLIGYADRSCQPGEHRSFDDYSLLEILDEATGEAIHEEGREGLIVITNLTRKLMPIIRYPVGDRGTWIEPIGTRDRKFGLLGRSEEAARIGLVKLYVEDIRKILLGFKGQLGISDFQMIVEHHDRLDGLILRIAASGEANILNENENAVIRLIHLARPLYEEFVRDQKIHPICIQWVKPGELESNPRTGKLKKVIDKRLFIKK